MRPHGTQWLLVLAAVVSLGCRGEPAASEAATPAARTDTPVKVREPAVAGLFYPKDPGALSSMIDELLAAAEPPAIPGKLKALISPHAGYPYSGPVAAYSYRLLTNLHFSTVILLAPSHYYPVRGASVSSNDVFRTPLGDVPIAKTAARKLEKLQPFMPEPHGPMKRPEWAPQSSRTAPAIGQDTPDTWEHADEVEVPFLQKTLNHFELLPVIMGPTDPAAAAAALTDVLDDDTLIVASSDLSHYHPYDVATRLDTHCVQAICDLDMEETKSQEACGILPIMTLMNIARQKGWKARLLDYRNSGDTTGDKSHGVVGYSAIAFYAPENAKADAPTRAETRMERQP
ncbi:MAG: AmmeMemoRadiSam system protein B [Candidatus Binatia bacterium]